VATAKGLGGGLPIAGITARADIVDQVHAGGLGGTFGGNPLSCAAALAAMDTITEDGLLDRATAIGQIMTTRLRSMQASYPSIGDVRGRGAMIAAELVGADGITPDPALTQKVAAACHADGVLVLTAGSYGNVLRFLPPLVISDDLLDDALGVIEKAFASHSGG
jgi:4-aminobutyrate aminotransferase/(S)-3-amino-2-methylpropionate transaminase